MAPDPNPQPNLAVVDTSTSTSRSSSPLSTSGPNVGLTSAPETVPHEPLSVVTPASTPSGSQRVLFPKATSRGNSLLKGAEEGRISRDEASAQTLAKETLPTQKSVPTLGVALTQSTPTEPSTAPTAPTTPPKHPQTPPNASVPLPIITPIKHKPGNHKPFQIYQAEKMVQSGDAWKEVRGHVVGPMPPDLFLETFMSPGTTSLKRDRDDEKPLYRKSILSKMAAVKEELDMYGIWVDELKQYCGSTVTQVDTHGHRVPDHDRQLMGPDISVYHGLSPGQIPTGIDRKTAELFLEFKFHKSADPFEDKASLPFVRKTKAAHKTLGQISIYAIAQLAAQFRTHIFSMLVFPTYARILRWDRSGVIVTKKITFADNGGIITKFFEHLQTASPEIRGVDTTVNPVSGLSDPQEAHIREALNVGADVPLQEVKIGTRRFIVAHFTFFSVSSAFGRSTRCILAYNLDPEPDEPETNMLKDSWRTIADDRLDEFSIYKRLEAAEVQNVPRAYCGGDITEGLNHRTQTPDYTKKDWSRSKKKPLQAFQHYRIAIQVIEAHLEKAVLVVNVVIAIRDAATAHVEAYIKAGILHRDISAANVMVNITGGVKGYLIDWDMAKVLPLPGAIPPQIRTLARTGTWYFIAARLISEMWQGSEQDFYDDIESFGHLLVYIASHFTSHSWGPSRKLTDFILSYFEKHEVVDHKVYGGEAKINFMQSNGSQLTQYLRNPALKSTIIEIIGVLGTRYPLFSDETKDGESVLVPDYSTVDQEKSKLLREDDYWLVKTLDKHLKDATGWGTHGGLVTLKPPGIDREGTAHPSKGETESRIAMSMTSSIYDIEEEEGVGEDGEAQGDDQQEVLEGNGEHSEEEDEEDEASDDDDGEFAPKEYVRLGRGNRGVKRQRVRADDLDYEQLRK
ncbi:hypothetical protein BDN72DRAFT_929676 [Pluteus cervinus]|uniref:Uncharacterized protein n=1 Tax=Pluteus cervinus TaxID=181527 RepID=A0ACD3AAH3_9AGAR|nr:hypothetical protein BDN72DRAFT_929676 [Pluteus cervinus]